MRSSPGSESHVPKHATTQEPCEQNCPLGQSLSPFGQPAQVEQLFPQRLALADRSEKHWQFPGQAPHSQDVTQVPLLRQTWPEAQRETQVPVVGSHC